jgi:hypothetical protein
MDRVRAAARAGIAAADRGAWRNAQAVTVRPARI